MKKFITDLRVIPGNKELIPLYNNNYGVITQIREPRSYQKCFEDVSTYQRDSHLRRCGSGKSFIQR